MKRPGTYITSIVGIQTPWPLRSFEAQKYVILIAVHAAAGIWAGFQLAKLIDNSAMKLFLIIGCMIALMWLYDAFFRQHPPADVTERLDHAAKEGSP